MYRKLVLLLGSAVLCAASLPTGLHAQQSSSQPRVIDLIADKDNTFKVPGKAKPVITLHSGETVMLRFTSYFGGEKSRDNCVHSFVIKKLREQGWDMRLKEGTQTFTVTAPAAAGEYLAECTVKCGRGHEDMNMKVEVVN